MSIWIPTIHAGMTELRGDLTEDGRSPSGLYFYGVLPGSGLVAGL
jgi:hypothetical protein